MLNRILIGPRTFCRDKQSLDGQVALNALDKRVLSDDIADDALLAYAIEGSLDKKWQRPCLTIRLSGSLKLKCQRCVDLMSFALNETAHIVLFEDEASLDAAMLADEDLEGMLLETSMDVLAVVEDQLLLALPFAPVHDVCCNADLDAVNQDKLNPFAVLAGLKKSD